MKKNQVELPPFEKKDFNYFSKPGIVFSFDDSFRVNDWYTYGKKIFEDNNVKVTFNINAFHHYENRREHNQEEIDMLIDLQSQGHEIAHHGYKHKNAFEYTERFGMKKWIDDEIEPLFDWMENQAHSKTGEKFKRPVTFAFPHFQTSTEIVNEIVPKYFKLLRGHLAGSNLVPFCHTGFAPSICIDSLYLSNPANIKKIIKFAEKYHCNLIITCHSLLPDDVSFNMFGWEMAEHEKRWKTSPKIIESIISEARKNNMTFYTTAEIAGVATFIDRGFEREVRKLLSKSENEWILISELDAITELDLRKIDISHYGGIQYFSKLKKLYLKDNQLPSSGIIDKLVKSMS